MGSVFYEDFDTDVAFIGYFTFLYNNSLWSHEMATVFLTCQP